MPFIMNELWQKMLGTRQLAHPENMLPVPAILTVIACTCLLCVAMLNARIRAREVVRG